MEKYNLLNFYLLFIILLTSTSKEVNGDSMLNWFWGKTEESPIVVSDGVPLVNIPYEMLTEDEKFLKEAAKFVTDIQVSSPLEVCQHKVVLKIKTSCSSMTEEQLAKLSVNLLNCQSETEGRRTYPCTEQMSIKQCTTHMDADTWNAYHLISNRARAVCYTARSQQFRALTELTVNKLMQSAHSQIQTLSSLKESQDRLEEKTIAAHKIVESNIQELTEEKALIRAGHTQLAAMAEEIKKKLENASRDILEQSVERSQNHQEILEDLEKIQKQAEALWKKIENSTSRIIEQNYDAAIRYEETLKRLEKINETILYVSDLTNNMRIEIDKKLGWITEYIGTTGESIEKVYRITLHVIYLLAAMIFAAFLQAPFLTRSAILGVVPLNLLSYLKHGLNASLDFLSLTVLIILITAMHYLMNGIQYLVRSKDQNEKDQKVEYKKTIPTSDKAEFHRNAQAYYSTDNINEKPVEKLSWFSYILYKVNHLFNFIVHQIAQSLENLKAVYLSIKSWVLQKISPKEELSCSYLPARKFQHVVPNKGYISISEESSDFSDSRDSGRFVYENNSVTGAVLRRKTATKGVSPLTALLRGHSEPKIRETIHAPISRDITPTRITPISKPVCAAKTRSGNPCRLMASKGQNFCHRHNFGSSVMSD